MQFDFKKIRYDLLAILIFLVVSLLYCLPQLSGKKLAAHDNVSWIGASHEASMYHDSTQKEVLWSNSMFGGMPTYTTAVYLENNANPNFLSYVQNALQSVGKPAYFFFISMLCFYLLMCVLRVNRWVGAIAAFAYAFATYNPVIISFGHDTKMMTMAYVPAAIAGLVTLYNGKWLSGAALWGVAVALMATNNHFQVIYYYLFMFLAFGVTMLFAAIKTGRIKEFIIASAIAAVTGGLGAGVAMMSILPTNEYAKATMRGGASELSGHDNKTNGGLDKEYAFRWSNGIGETFCIMIPYLYGGSSGEPADKAPKTNEAINGSAEKLPLYWGPQPFLSGPVYFGAAICFLFVLGMLVLRGPHKWWMLAAAIWGVVLSWGKNAAGINYFLFDHLPMLNKFRTPSMSLVVPQFIFPLVAALAVNEVLKYKGDRQQLLKNLVIALASTAGLCIVLGLLGTAFFQFTGPADAQIKQEEIVKLLKEDRAGLAMQSSLWSAVLILAMGGLIWAYINNRIKQNVLIIGMAVIMATDLLPLAHEYLNDTNYEEASDFDRTFQPRKVDEQIWADAKARGDVYYRVFDNTRDVYNDAVHTYFHKSIGGYSPAKMEIYQDLIDRQLSKYNGEVLNMLNTRYIIIGRDENNVGVRPNPDACGNAWFVEEIRWAKTADDEMNLLNAATLGDTVSVPNAFKAVKQAVLRETYKPELANFNIGKDSTSAIKLTRYGLDDLSFASHNTHDGLAVFSDIYYDKGWKAYVDGKETPIMRVDYVLRAIKVPQGNHNIDFKFRPETFYKGKSITMATSLVLLLICIGALVPVFTGKKIGEGASVIVEEETTASETVAPKSTPTKKA
ncbi:MAG: hypothetical protein EBZ77_04645 [Chitinophagia bacterium]|nr:hypothetical protein [Chitinophagia bacterium]